MINCKKDCPNRERMPHASAIRYHQAVAGICNQCRYEQLKDEDGCIEDLIGQRDGWRKQFADAEDEIRRRKSAMQIARRELINICQCGLCNEAIDSIQAALFVLDKEEDDD